MIRPTIHRMPDDLILSMAQSLRFSLLDLVQATPNEFSNFERRGLPLDRRWRVQLTTPVLEEKYWGRLHAFFMRIGGVSGAFSLFNPIRHTPKGVTAGAGAGQDINPNNFSDGTIWSDGTGVFAPPGGIGYIKDSAAKGQDIITVKGMVADTTNSIMESDNLSIHHGGIDREILYTSVTRARSNSAGETVIRIAPRLRLPVRTNDIVRFVRARSPFQLIGDIDPLVEGFMHSSIAFECIEVPELLGRPVERDLTR